MIDPGEVGSPMLASAGKSSMRTRGYSYAYPAPQGIAEAEVAPEGAYFDRKLGEFLLPYAVVQISTEPETVPMAFPGAHIGPQPILAVGIAPRSNVPWANPSDRAP